MPQLLKTIDEYTVERARDTYWLVFNTSYNDLHAFGKKLYSEDSYLNTAKTDQKAREEFIEYMRRNFPDTELTEVFDLVTVGYLVYPYLGSIAIDCDKDSEVFKALSEKYGNPYDAAQKNNAVFWILSYEDAQKFLNKKKNFIEAELESF